MPRCKHCEESFNEKELEEAGIILGESESIEDMEVCPECRKGVEDFTGDFNLFHPEETQQEFSDHEDEGC